MVASGQERAAEAAAELMKSMTRLRARLRSETAPTEMSATWSQLTTLARIIAEGPTTTSALAQAEHVTAEPDPADGRKTLIAVTEKGRQLSATIPAAREAWLSSAIGTLLDAEDQQVLLKAAAIIDRIADSHP